MINKYYDTLYYESFFTITSEIIQWKWKASSEFISEFLYVLFGYLFGILIQVKNITITYYYATLSFVSLSVL